GVVVEKNRPAQVAGARQERAEHAETGDEARDEHRLRAMTAEEVVELREPVRCEPDPPAVTLENAASQPAADDEAEVVAEHGGAKCRDDDPRERQATVVRQRRAREQRRLPRDRQPGILQKDTEEHDGVPVAREQIEDPGRHYRAPGPRRGRPGRSAVIAPSATTRRPLTKTCLMPVE